MTIEKIAIGYFIALGLIPITLKVIRKNSDKDIFIITGFLVFFWSIYLVYSFIRSFYVRPQSSKYAEWI